MVFKPCLQESSFKYDSMILFLITIISKGMRAYFANVNWSVSTGNLFQTTPSHQTLWLCRHLQLEKTSHETHEREVPDQSASLHSQYSQEGQDKFPSVRTPFPTKANADHQQMTTICSVLLWQNNTISRSTIQSSTFMKEFLKTFLSCASVATLYQSYHCWCGDKNKPSLSPSILLLFCAYICFVFTYCTRG